MERRDNVFGREDDDVSVGVATGFLTRFDLSSG